MTPLQARRQQVCFAIDHHLVHHGSRNWRILRETFPDVPEPTFFRWVREVKASELASPGVPGLRITLHGAYEGLIDYAERHCSAATASRPAARHAVAEPAPERADTIADLMAIYEVEVLSQQRAGRNARSLLSRVTEALADIACRDLTEDHIAPIIEAMARETPIQANRALAGISALCGWGFARGDLDWNPARYVQKPVAETPRERSLSMPEVAEVWLAAELLGHPFGPAVQLLILTAARRGDVAGMHQNDLARSGDGHLLWSVDELNHGDRERFLIPLAPQVETIVGAAIAAAPSGSDLIFTTTGTTGISGWPRAKRRLDQLVRSRRLASGCNVDMAPWRLGDLRRTFFDRSMDFLHGDQDILNRCLRRMAGFTRAFGKAWAHSHHMLEVRTYSMFVWATLVESEVAKAVAASG